MSCLVTQCFVVRTKGHEVRIVGNQDRDNSNNCAQHIGSRRPAVLRAPSSRTIEGKLVILVQFYTWIPRSTGEGALAMVN